MHKKTYSTLYTTHTYIAAEVAAITTKQTAKAQLQKKKKVINMLMIKREKNALFGARKSKEKYLNKL